MISRLGADGSVHVWVAGWEVVFPVEAGDPVLRRTAPPSDFAGAEAGEVRVARIEDRVGVRLGDRMALVSAADPG